MTDLQDFGTARWSRYTDKNEPYCKQCNSLYLMHQFADSASTPQAGTHANCVCGNVPVCDLCSDPLVWGISQLSEVDLKAHALVTGASPTIIGNQVYSLECPQYHPQGPSTVVADFCRSLAQLSLSVAPDEHATSEENLPMLLTILSRLLDVSNRAGFSDLALDSAFQMGYRLGMHRQFDQASAYYALAKKYATKCGDAHELGRIELYEIFSLFLQKAPETESRIQSFRKEASARNDRELLHELDQFLSKMADTEL